MGRRALAIFGLATAATGFQPLSTPTWPRAATAVRSSRLTATTATGFAGRPVLRRGSRSPTPDDPPLATTASRSTIRAASIDPDSTGASFDESHYAKLWASDPQWHNHAVRPLLWSDRSKPTSATQASMDLLLQRSIQSFVAWEECAGGVDTMAANTNTMTNFFDHQHLDDGSKWHSLIGMRAHFLEYFRALLKEEVLLNSPATKVSTGKIHVQNGWNTHASTRPADALMAVASYLASEWREDLQILARVNNKEKRHEMAAVARRMRKGRKQVNAAQNAKAVANTRGDATGTNTNTNTNDASIVGEGNQQRNLNSADIHFTHTMGKSVKRQIALTWEKRGDSSPLRMKNFELLEREVTIRAVVALREEFDKLCKEGHQGSAEGLKFFEAHLKEWLPVLMIVGEPAGDDLCDTLLQALELRPPHISNGILIDPMSIAERIRYHREKAALQIAKEMALVDELLVELKREHLTRVFNERAKI